MRLVRAAAAVPFLRTAYLKTRSSSDFRRLCSRHLLKTEYLLASFLRGGVALVMLGFAGYGPQVRE
jgi:hypothetical protein